MPIGVDSVTVLTKCRRRPARHDYRSRQDLNPPRPRGGRQFRAPDRPVQPRASLSSRQVQEEAKPRWSSLDYMPARPSGAASSLVVESVWAHRTAAETAMARKHPRSDRQNKVDPQVCGNNQDRATLSIETRKTAECRRLASAVCARYQKQSVKANNLTLASLSKVALDRLCSPTTRLSPQVSSFVKRQCGSRFMLATWRSCTPALIWTRPQVGSPTAMMEDDRAVEKELEIRQHGRNTQQRWSGWGRGRTVKTRSSSQVGS